MKCNNKVSFDKTDVHLRIPLNSSGTCNRVLQEISVHANGLPILRPPIYVIEDPQPMIVGLRALENWNLLKATPVVFASEAEEKENEIEYTEKEQTAAIFDQKDFTKEELEEILLAKIAVQKALEENQKKRKNLFEAGKSTMIQFPNAEFQILHHPHTVMFYWIPVDRDSTGRERLNGITSSCGMSSHLL